MYHASLEPHTIAPNFALPCTDRHLFELNKHLIGKPLVLFFYPKSGTASSIEEVLSFKEAYKDFSDLGITVLGVSQDSLTTQLQFKAQ
jgi:peroxiredoxin Q/BCP